MPTTKLATLGFLAVGWKVPISVAIDAARATKVQPQLELSGLEYFDQNAGYQMLTWLIDHAKLPEDDHRTFTPEVDLHG